MEPVVGIFSSREKAEQAAKLLQAIGISHDHLNLLTPDVSQSELASVPTTDAEQPGLGPVLGGLVGGAVGALAGMQLGTVAGTLLIPGIGPITAIGLLGTTLFGLGGALGGVAAGSALEKALTAGIPKDELFLYEDALMQGRSVVLALAEDAALAEAARRILQQQGAESIDAARERWWLGLRDAEEESYTAQGEDFDQDEFLYRRGFEAAQHPDTRGKSYGAAKARLQQHDPEAYGEDAFRQGFERGQAYAERLKETSKK